MKAFGKAASAKASLAIVTAGLLSISALAAGNAPELRFSKDGKFKIVQFTDTHLTELESKGKDEPKEVMAERAAKLEKELFAAINKVLDEEKPDLVVFTGDNVLTKNQPFEQWRKLVAPAVSRGIPWAAVMGNHDFECTGKPQKEIMGFLETLPLSLCKRGPEELGGGGNYIALIKDANSNQPRAALYFMDSGTYADKKLAEGYAWFSFDKIQWFRKQSEAMDKANGGAPLPSLAFFHIPFPEFDKAFATCKTVGTKKENVCSPQVSSGMFVAMLESKSILGCFVGHDHDNDCMSSLNGIGLAYGRKTGAFCYFNLPVSGGRAIELSEGSRSFSTWIRLGNGEIESKATHPEDFPPPPKKK